MKKINSTNCTAMVEDKYISKNRHNSHVKTSRECSPFRSSGKSSSHSSPSARKRGYISPNLLSKSSTSPYENSRTKKDRAENDMGKNDCVISDPRTESKLDDDMVIKRVSCRRCPVNGFKEEDWSEHLSSSGKIYYYNKRTEESQWEVPKGWHDRNDRDHDSKECSHKERSSRGSVNSSSKESNNRDEYREVREVRDPRENKDYNKYREKNPSSSSKDHRLSDSRSYRDLRKSREKESRESRDRDYRDREGRDYDGKHRHTPGSSKRDLKYSVRSTIGLSTPSSSSSSSSHRSYRRSTSNSVNGAGSGSGNVQDISPPGTPTNDDIVIITTVCSTPVYTTQSASTSSPLVTTPIATTRVPPPTTPHTPIVLSPVVHSTPTISTSYLHPLQQALLLQQQQSTTTVTTKETFGSPKLPTVKNHVQEIVQVSTPTSSPRVSLISTPQQKSIPMVQSPEILDRSITPPPPPPPPKETSKNFNESSKDRTPKPERQNSSTPIATTPVAALVPQAVDPSSDQIEINNRTKILEVHPADESPVKLTYRAFNTERLIKKTIKLEREELVTFAALPDIEQYSEYFSPSVADLNTSFYCNALENQISSTWEETMSMLHTEGYRSKFNLAMCRQNVDCQDCKLDVSSGWVDALNAVIQKVESLQDSSMSSEARTSSRDSKSNSTKRNRLDTNNDSYSDGCEKGDNHEIEHNSKEKNSTAITEPLNNNKINDPSQVPPRGCVLGSAPSEINNSSR